MREHVARYRTKDVCSCGSEKVRSATCCLACSAANASRRAAEARATKAQERKQLVHVGPSYPMSRLPAGHPARQAVPKARLWISGPCAWCGAEFTVQGQPAARYCSRKCRARSHGKGFHITRRARLAIYARDGATCQLCLEPVDLTLSPGDIWSATLDHIVPQSKGGTHEPENLRLAHLWCNSVRGDETYYTDVVLRVA